MSGTGNNVAFIPATGDAFIDGVLTDYRWSDSIIYYSFPSNNSVYSYTQLTGIPANFSALSSAQEDAANFALNTAYGGSGFTATASAGFAVEGFTNASIVLDTVADTTDKEHIRLANTSPAQVSTARVADFPGNSETTQIEDNGDVWFGGSGDNPTAGNYDWHTVLHEIGHALGLSHGHSTFQKGVALPAAYDSMEYSIMTYRAYVGGGTGGYGNETWGFAQTYMMADIAALQHMYGANYTVNNGATVYKWNPTSGDTLVNGEVAINAGGNRIFATIWDGGGVDTYDLSSYTTNLTLDLRAGEYSVFSSTQLANLGGANYSRGNIFNARLYNNNTASLIENAIGGSGNDTIRGNQANNVLTGNAGDDTMYGYEGGDTFIGGAGRDSMYGSSGNDTFSYTAATAPLGLSEYIDGGTNYDRVLLNGAGTFNFGEDFNVNGVEELEFAADGANVDKTIIMGNKELDSSAEWLNLVVDGNNNTGSDDTIIVNLGYTANVNLSGWTFIDWVTSGSNIDRIYINGDANNNNITGSSQNDIIIGGAGTDTIHGGDGNDHITSDGDSGFYYGDGGNDTMLSGLGNETMDGGAGTDLIDHRAYNGSYVFNMVTGMTNFAGESYLNFENVYMGDGSDTVTGTSGANTIYAFGGNDTVNAGAGDDYVVGGDGDDVLNGDSGTDTIFGGNGNDTINGGSFKDTVYGQAGDDTFLITGGDFGDNIDGGADTDLLDLSGWTNASIAFMVNLATSSYEFLPNGFGIDGEYTLTNVENVTGSNFGDDIRGDGGDNVLRGGGGDDIIRGGGGINTIYGDDGNDRIFRDGGSALQDAYYGGNGTDTIDTNGSGFVSGVLFDMANNIMKLNGADYEVWDGFENYDGATGTGHESVTGTAGNNTILTGSGNNTIDGGGGDDTINGGGGNDTIDGGAGTDMLYGGDGNDILSQNFGGPGELLDGGNGIDTATWAYSSGNWIIDLAAGTAKLGATVFANLVSIENVVGGSGDDTITGDGGNNILRGGAGNDVIVGGAGVDSINGGDGNDTITSDGDGGVYLGEGGNDMMLSGLGDETMDGGAGVDTIDHRAWNGAYIFDMVTGLTNFAGESYLNFENVFMGNGVNTVTGNGTKNEIHGGSAKDTVDGGGGNDKIWGGDGADELHGVGGRDKIYGGNGNDMLFGDFSKDRLFGGRHKDILDGGVGDDYLSGGKGKDKFDFYINGGDDKIADFTNDIDTLRLDEDLWGGGKSKAQVIADHASVVGNDVVFNFAGGESITLLGFGPTGEAALLNDLAFI